MKKVSKKQLLLSVEKLRELDNDQLHGAAGGQECTVWTRCRKTVTGQSADCR